MAILRSNGKQSWESMESVLKKKRLRLEGFKEKEGFKPVKKQWGGDGRWEWWIDGTDGGRDKQVWFFIRIIFLDILYTK